MIPSAILAYVLARHRFPGRRILSTMLSLPLVLPPTAVGYLLLQLLSIDSPVGQLLNALHVRILLTWRGAVLAAMVIAMPLVVRTASVAFQGVDPRLEAMDRTLGHTRFQTLRRVTIPLASRGLISAAILGFTRAVGEFGATVTLAGNIPGQTQTLASAIFSAQSAGQDTEAWVLLGFSLLVGIVAVYTSERLSDTERAHG
ncbi:MAG: molybdate ABC transporter permease subunit [Rhodobacterales bacterium]|nr:molybdate ABC transporter permease subunit [Rhodobacterales bacterium]